jgi:hypothetical protein
MPMVAFYSKFRDLAFREMRVVGVFEHEFLPAGEYGLLEFYCNERGCDCRRVILQVLRSDTGWRVWASINFGWETPSFYRKWMHGDAEAARGMWGPTLDPLNPQSQHSPALLGLFRDVVLKDRAYVQRLRRHYNLFKMGNRSRPVAARNRKVWPRDETRRGG